MLVSRKWLNPVASVSPMVLPTDKRYEDMEGSCIRGSSDGTLGKRSRLWSITETGSPWNWSRHKAHESSRSI